MCDLVIMRREFMVVQAFDGQMLTPRFLDHLFQETKTYPAPNADASTTMRAVGETGLAMDFRGFLDFAFAMHQSEEVASIKYFWCVPAVAAVFCFPETCLLLSNAPFSFEQADS